MGAAVVVFVGEGVELGLELGQGCGSGLAGEPAFEGLVESFDFAAGGGVIGGGVDLAHAQAVQFGFVLVAAAFAAGESGGEDHAVVGEGGVRDAVFGNGFGEFVGDGGAGDVGVGGDGECVAGVVVDPAQDFGVGAVGEVPVGVVGLPALVGLFGGKADEDALGRLWGLGVMSPAALRWRLMEATETRSLWWCRRCQAMVWGPASSPVSVRVWRRAMIRSMVVCGSRVGLVWGRRDRGWYAASPSSV